MEQKILQNVSLKDRLETLESSADKVEININADNLMCSLISPEANDFISDFKDTIIDEQLKLIEEIAPTLAVIEQ